MDDDPSTIRQRWKFDLGKQLLSFIAGVIIAAFILGSARQKATDLAKWREDIAPKIERMDATGTLSFAHFQIEYNRTQSRQEEFMKELERRVRDLERYNNRPENK